MGQPGATVSGQVRGRWVDVVGGDSNSDRFAAVGVGRLGIVVGAAVEVVVDSGKEGRPIVGDLAE